MSWRRALVSLAAIVAFPAGMATFSSCSAPAEDASARMNPLEHVSSACDDHGNRVYRHSAGSISSVSIAVVGADPTCRSLR